MAVREYIGARYVPIFGRVGETSTEWDNSAPYEPLTVVTYQGASYTSRQYVPAGIPITDEDFWVVTGNYNAQVEAYRQEVRTYDGRITANANSIDTLGDDIASETQARADADTALSGDLATLGNNLETEREERIAADAVLEDKIGKIRTWDVVDSACLGANMSFYGSYEFDSSPYAQNVSADYINGGTVLDDILYVYSDNGSYTNNAIIRRFDMAQDLYIGQTSVPIKTHSAAMSSYNGYIYVCGSIVAGGPTYMYKLNQSLNLLETTFLGSRLYAVAKTANPTSEEGMFIGFCRDTHLIINFNIVNGQFVPISKAYCNMEKTTNGVVLARDDKMLCINSINATSVTVYDLENCHFVAYNAPEATEADRANIDTIKVIGECSITVEDSPCELEDAVWYDGQYIGVFSVNEHSNWRRTSASLGLAKIRLFSDVEIDADTDGGWLAVNGYNRVWCKHAVGQRNFKGDGTQGKPLMSLTFAVGMLNSTSSGIDISVNYDSTFFHFPLLRASNCVYMHESQLEDTPAPIVKINDCISVANGAYLRIYVTELNGWFVAADPSNSEWHGSCIWAYGATIMPNIDRYTADAVRAIFANYCMVNIGKEIERSTGMLFSNSHVINYDRDSVFGPIVSRNSILFGVKIWDSETDNTLKLVNFIKNVKGQCNMVLKLEKANSFVLIPVSNSSINYGTFEGASYTPAFGLVGVRLYRNENALVVDVGDASGNASGFSLTKVIGN